jgi:transcriptional regulator with XRE-family HTH domain
VPRTRSREHIAFGRALRQLRDAQNLSQEQLGYKAGLHRNYIGGVERAELNPTLTSIVKLARALSMQPSELLAAAEALPRRSARS